MLTNSWTPSPLLMPSLPQPQWSLIDLRKPDHEFLICLPLTIKQYWSNKGLKLKLLKLKAMS
jgi:hypothetical protein